MSRDAQDVPQQEALALAARVRVRIDALHVRAGEAEDADAPHMASFLRTTADVLGAQAAEIARLSAALSESRAVVDAARELRDAEAAALTRAAAALEDAPPPSTAENVAAAMDHIRWLTSPGAWVPGARVLDVVEGR